MPKFLFVAILLATSILPGLNSHAQRPDYYIYFDRKDNSVAKILEQLKLAYDVKFILAPDFDTNAVHPFMPAVINTRMISLSKLLEVFADYKSARYIYNSITKTVTISYPFTDTTGLISFDNKSAGEIWHEIAKFHHLNISFGSNFDTLSIGYERLTGEMWLKDMHFPQFCDWLSKGNNQIHYTYNANTKTVFIRSTTRWITFDDLAAPKIMDQIARLYNVKYKFSQDFDTVSYRTLGTGSIQADLPLPTLLKDISNGTVQFSYDRLTNTIFVCYRVYQRTVRGPAAISRPVSYIFP